LFAFVVFLCVLGDVSKDLLIGREGGREEEEEEEGREEESY